ncbi:MAG: hypothetical protein NZ889_01695 [Candidatus Pacearchaeota archaeon]|nr:hypothetical protein [Candidatus Pacearchaeota archaeon]
MISIPALIGLAAADAVNPCELAVLLLALVAILTRYPRERKKVLQTGFMFAFAIFFMYLLYGIALINFFDLITRIKSVSGVLYKLFGIVGIILGALNIKDFFAYGTGFITEVPRSWRHSMKNLIAKITSPIGAFFVGILVAFFLTPCTMGPYVIASGLLHPLGFLKALPFLILYNAIFISPMIFVTLAVYFGFKTVEQIQGWREKNIRLLHLIAGLILVAIGFFLLFGLF